MSRPAPKKQPDPDRVRLVNEVAAELRVTDQHVLDLIEEGELQAINVGGHARKFWRIPVESLRAFIRSRDSLVNPR